MLSGKWVAAGVAVLLVLLVAALFAGYAWRPAETEKVAYIYRDEFGIPHIYADTDEGVMYAFGYAQAEDHLEDMVRNYLAVNGRLSKFFGEAYLQQDLLVKALRIKETAENWEGQISPEVYGLILSFAEGVNRYIEEHGDELPSWVASYRVTAEDVIALQYYAMLSRSIGWAMKELKGASAESAGWGSNEWAVAPSKTVDGSTVLLGDPHLPWSGLNRWYEAHLEGDKLHVYGATLYGLPFILIGFNRNIAWTLTRNGVDLADIFVEKLNPEDPTLYLAEDGWRRAESLEVTVKVKKGDGLKTLHRVFYYTRHGLVVKADLERGFAYAMALEGYGNLRAIEETYRINAASNLEEFKEALKLRGLILWNVLYADVDGNIYYVYNAAIHLKSEKYSHREPRPGWEADAQWGDIIPFNELPQVGNPASGFIQNNNVMPWFVTVESGIKPEDYPAYLVDRDAEMNDRGIRAFSVLSSKEKFTAEELYNLAVDVHVVAADKYLDSALKEIKEALAGGKFAEHIDAAREALEILEGWNREALKDEPGMTVFYFWYRRYRQTRDVVEAFRLAVEDMLACYGKVDVKWGSVHVFSRGNITLPIDGGDHLAPTLWMAGHTMAKCREVCASGSSFTMLVYLKPGNITAYTLIPYGESENPSSPHYADQMPLKSQRRLKPVHFYREDVEKYSVEVTRLRLP